MSTNTLAWNISALVVGMVARTLWDLIIYWKRGPSILDLPPELLDLIFPHLSVVSQACLAVSCKKLYRQFAADSKAPAFRTSNSMKCRICDVYP